ncbi:hypothetical protein NDU88_001872 [Pleurodeles waltl]|uniref:Uncharacterized protein n=1 Tax=Pleurodeles waltl TaxID=8319 RepID=A0AAV7WNQ9_PLEWA|nr:hypothetical protein NDU88_001872 [Pleurodeles waltl]
MGLAQRASKGLRSSAEILTQMATSVLRDHEYELDFTETPGRLPASELARPEESQSSVSHSSDSKQARDEPKVLGKRKCKSHHTTEVQ